MRRIKGPRLVTVLSLIGLLLLTPFFSAVSSAQGVPPTVTPSPTTFIKDPPLLPTATPPAFLPSPTPTLTPTTGPAAGAGWRLVIPEGSADSPERRSRFGYAWDTAAGRLLVFGGRRGPSGVPNQRGNDLFSFTPATGWIQLRSITSPPPPREEMAAAFDSLNNRLLIFGGETGTDILGTIESDLWAYSPSINRWDLLQPAPDPNAGVPPARIQAAAAWDTSFNRMLIYGGLAADRRTLLNDLWAFYPGQIGGTQMRWERLSNTTPPPARTDHVGVWATQLNQFLIFGGTGAAGPLSDVWAWTQPVPVVPGTTPPPGAWTSLSASGRTDGPLPRAGAGGTWDTLRSRLVIFGGYASGSTFNDLWAFAPSNTSWIQLAGLDLPEGPTRRQNMALVWGPNLNRLFVFAGDQNPETANSSNHTNDMWEFIEGAQVVITPTVTPTPFDTWWIGPGVIWTATPLPTGVPAPTITALPRTGGGPLPVWLLLASGFAVSVGYAAQRRRRK